MKTAASSKPPTAARPGRRFSIQGRHHRRRRSSSSHPDNSKIGYTALMEHYTRPRRASGHRIHRAPPAFIKPPTAATPGRSSPKVCPADAWDASVLATSTPTARRSSPSWREAAVDAAAAVARAVSIGPTTAARTGPKARRIRASRAAATSAASSSTPTIPIVVYVAQTSLYRSDDGGKTFSSYKGAPRRRRQPRPLDRPRKIPIA